MKNPPNFNILIVLGSVALIVYLVRRAKQTGRRQYLSWTIAGIAFVDVAILGVQILNFFFHWIK